MRMPCGINRTATFTAVVFAASMTLPLMAGEDLATSATYESFNLDTSGRQIVVSSQSDLVALANKPVAYRAGESVTVIAPDGGNIALVTSAAADGDATFSPTSGGLWQLVNSKGQTVPVGVAWSVFNDGWILDLGTSSPFVMYTNGEGPDRKGYPEEFPAVSYSGDRWYGNTSAASTVTFIPQKGETVSMDMTGTGTTPFSFKGARRWIVRLDGGSGISYESIVRIGGNFCVSLR